MAEAPMDSKAVVAALSDPIRLRATECLSTGPLTAEAIARRLGLATNRLHYQLRVLEGARVIRVVDTVRDDGLTQPRYGLDDGARVWNDEIPRCGDVDAQATYFGSGLHATADDVRDTLLDPDRGLTGFTQTCQVLRTTPAVFRELTERVEALLAEARQFADDPAAHEYRITFVGYQRPANPDQLS